MAYRHRAASLSIARSNYTHPASQPHQSHRGSRTTYRTYTLAHRLPREIVVGICGVYVKELYVESNVCRNDVVEGAQLLLQSVINMSQVCRFWRGFITSDPSLWCHFINPHHRSHRWTSLLLDRSKPLPITYATISPDFIIDKDVFARELTCAGRLSSYSVAFNLNCKVWHDNYVPANWPYLRSLCIAHFTFDDADFMNVDSGMESEEMSEDSDYDDEGYLRRGVRGYEHDQRFIKHNTDSLLMPKDFPSRRTTPRLERLHLHTCALRSMTQITGLTMLTELHVSNNRYWNALEWANILSRLPRLKKVALDRVISNQHLNKKDMEYRYPLLNFETFYLRDDIYICAQFLIITKLEPRRIFQLICDETQNDIESYTKAVFTRVSSIVRRLIATNPLFSNCALQIGHGSIEFLGYPDNQDLETLPGDAIGTSGPSTFTGAVIELDFFCGDKQTQDVLSKWMELFRPLFGNIDSLMFREDDNNSGLILDDTWLSDLLWESSHRLSEIIGINHRGWKTVCQNMFPNTNERPADNHPQRSNKGFLKALQRLELWVSPSPVGAQFKSSVLAFCREKQIMGAPLEYIRPMMIPADSLRVERDCKDLIEQLRKLRVPVNPNYYSDSDPDE